MSESDFNKLWLMAMKYRDSGEYNEAGKIYRQMLVRFPDNAKVLYELGYVCYLQHNIPDAIEFLGKACIADPVDPMLHFSLAAILAAAGDHQNAIAHYQKTLQLKHDFDDAYLNLGAIFYDMPDYSSAINCLVQAINTNDNNAKAHYNLGLVYMRVGRSEDADKSFRRALEIEPDNHIIDSSILYNLHNLPDLSAQDIFDEHVRWGQQHAAHLLHKWDMCKHVRAPYAPVRVGYVSPDFRRHSVACYISPLLKAHDRNVVVSYCYSDVLKPDNITNQLKSQADNWRDISNLNDDQFVQLVRDDDIDILVDLAGHTDRNRLLAFARKPSRIQVTYLGYPDTTGLHAIDYRISDGLADPHDIADHFHTEELVRLESCFLCYEPPDGAPITGRLPVLDNSFITFGSFNNLSKINEKVISAWSRILKSVPGSRMLLKAKGLGDNEGRSRIYSGFRSNDIPDDRVECVGYIGETDQHLEKYNNIDIALDTFPYNGTTTTCEALWMGVPVISMSGDRHSSRVGVSLLSAIGLAEYAAASADHYVALATRLALDIETLGNLRQTLRQRVQESSLMDSEKFTRGLEWQYKKMLEKNNQ